MSKWIDLRRLPVQLIIGFIAVVILTVLTGGLPTLLLLRGQLDQQAWSRVEQGQHTARVLYESMQKEIEVLASLAGHQIFKNYSLETFNIDIEAATSDLLEIVSAGEIDFLVYCDIEDDLLIATDSNFSSELCASKDKGFYSKESGGVDRDIWLIVSVPVDLEGEKGDHVIAGVSLDNDFARDMEIRTGLHHTLLLDGRPFATSFEGGLSDLSLVAQRPASGVGVSNDSICVTFELDCQSYYAARFPLKGTPIQVEVALAVTDIEEIQNQLSWIVIGSVLGMVILGSGLGVLLARRISAPLVKLAESATAMSQGDLEMPVKVESGVIEAVKLAQALESARGDLLRTLTELRKEKAWSEHLINSIVEGIMTLDEQGIIVFFSQGAERITGWSREDVLGRHCDDVFILAEGRQSFSKTLPDMGDEVKIPVTLAEDHQTILSVTCAELTPTQDGEARLAVVFRDESGEHIIHRLLGQFMANAAHEFRTPLAALAASVELLRDQASDFTPEEMDELLISLHLGILRFQNLVDNLLESANIEAGHFHVYPRPYDLDVIIHEAIETMRPLLDKYGQSVVVDMPEHIPVVQADPRRTVQVLVNMLSNASKFGPPDAEISLTARVEDNFVRVSIGDYGPGIPADKRADVFRRLQFPGIADDHSKVGAGLGLSVVKAVIEALGGEVGVEGFPGGGSSFWFTLPQAEDT